MSKISHEELKELFDAISEVEVRLENIIGTLDYFEDEYVDPDNWKQVLEFKKVKKFFNEALEYSSSLEPYLSDFLQQEDEDSNFQSGSF